MVHLVPARVTDTRDILTNWRDIPLAVVVVLAAVLLVAVIIGQAVIFIGRSLYDAVHVRRPHTGD